MSIQLPSSVKGLQHLLISDAPIALRMRVVFLLKQIGSVEAIDALIAGFHSGPATHSVLLKHEICYVLGQLQLPDSLPFLYRTIRDVNEDDIVRHEAGEAIAAIGQLDSLGVLEEVFRDLQTPREVKDTCEIGIEMIKHRSKNVKFENEGNHGVKIYNSVDPAPSFEKNFSVAELTEILLNQSLSLFERYRAMFSLRDIGTEEAVLALAKGLQDENALFKHEIAFVFGQMHHSSSLDALKETLNRESEHPMVRHEAAEAMGSVFGNNELSCEGTLIQEYATKQDTDLIVKQSCEVALDIQEYWSSEDAFDTAL